MDSTELRRRRQHMRLSQAQLAEHLGVPANTISRWELGMIKMDQPKVIDLALRQLEDVHIWAPYLACSREISAVVKQLSAPLLTKQATVRLLGRLQALDTRMDWLAHHPDGTATNFQANPPWQQGDASEMPPFLGGPTYEELVDTRGKDGEKVSVPGDTQ